jgi:hypothetical protein
MKIRATTQFNDNFHKVNILCGSLNFNIFLDLDRFEVENYDFAVWPLLLHGIASNDNLEIDLPITEELLFHSRVLQSFLNQHLKLPIIQIVATNRISGLRNSLFNQILPFSGGVDSCFTLLYNHFELQRRVDAALFVRGLDIFDEMEYNLACESLQPILRLTNTPLIKAKTDFRRRISCPFGWKMHCYFVLGGFLHIFDKYYNHALISGDGDGGVLSVSECLQTPFLNERLFFLFSNHLMQIQAFDGANHDKLQKIAYLSKFPDVLANLRVCWEKRKHFNCGRCKKCIITQLSFIAAGGFIPPCFPTKADSDDIEQLFNHIESSHSRDPDSPNVILPKQLLQILNLAKHKNIRHPLLDKVAYKLVRH